MVEEVKLDQTQASQATQVLETVSPLLPIRTMAGFYWFLLVYPGPYMHQLYPFLGEERADCSVGGVGPEVGPMSRSL